MLSLKSLLIVLFILQAAIFSTGAWAKQVTVAAVFADGAVLQRQKPLEVWGRAPPDTNVEVKLGEQESLARSNPDGLWRVQFAPLSATDRIVLSVSSDESPVTKHVLAVGDVFLCSGQSNMAFTMAETALARAQRRMPIDQTIRLLKIQRHRSPVALSSFVQPPRWSTAADAGEGFSAVCLLAGRELARKQAIPIGLIEATWGGTPIEAWLPFEELTELDSMGEAINILEAYREDPDKAEKLHGERLAQLWQFRPATANDPGRSRMAFAAIHNAMLEPLRTLQLAGAIWYQGEANARNRDRRSHYQDKLAALISSWRKRHGSDLPVVLVQLAPFGQLSDGPEESAWAEIREAQRLVATADPRTALVVTSDIGERLDIHPPLKGPVGQRAARALEVLAYGADVGGLGPRPHKAWHDAGDIYIAFEGASRGLFAAGWGRPGPFQLCESHTSLTCQFADAQFFGHYVVVKIPHGFEPVLIRYCWGAAPICNIFDHGQRPLGPFELAITELHGDTYRGSIQ